MVVEKTNFSQMPPFNFDFCQIKLPGITKNTVDAIRNKKVLIKKFATNEL